jgi:hypothetical protein
MERTTTSTRIIWPDKTVDALLRQSKKLLIAELLLMIPIALLGLTIAAYPLSLPALYLLVLRFLE